MSEILITVDGVSKKFCRDLKRSLWYGMQDLGNELLGRRHGGNGELRKDEFWAVKDVSFELKRGECLGLIGPNGAGKSTLLKMLNGLIKPDQGRITLQGRVGALIELGAGFNPILSGRENIYVNGSILGFTKKEIDRKLDEIIDFAEIEEFIDTPVQSYSSGMKVRLGFAVAAQMDPDILLLDEVLAVGDVGFRAKCYNAIYDISKKAAVIFVTHSLQQLCRLCSQAMVLNHGGVVLHDHRTSKAVEAYLGLFQQGGSRVIEPGDTRIVEVKTSCRSEDGYYVLNIYDDLVVSFNAFIEKGHSSLEVNVSIISKGDELVAQCNSIYNGYEIKSLGGSLQVQVTIPRLNLNPAFYALSISIVDSITNDILSWHHSVVSLKIQGSFYGGAPIQYKGDWSFSR